VKAEARQAIAKDIGKAITIVIDTAEKLPEKHSDKRRDGHIFEQRPAALIPIRGRRPRRARSSSPAGHTLRPEVARCQPRQWIDARRGRPP
jgi:hypothetical protein